MTIRRRRAVWCLARKKNTGKDTGFGMVGASRLLDLLFAGLFVFTSLKKFLDIFSQNLYNYNSNGRNV